MVIETSGTKQGWLRRGARHGMRFAVVAVVSVVGVVAAAGAVSAAKGADAGGPSGPCASVAAFATEIQWGGVDAPWHADADLTIAIANRQQVIGNAAVPVGTQVVWSGPNGNANITFFGSGSFSGSAQFPNEGPVGYRGTLRATDVGGPSGPCASVAAFATEIQWGGVDAPWHVDEGLTIAIANRQQVIGNAAVPVGTQVVWSGPNGNANITFFGSGSFSGSAQFPNEGPVGYRGTIE